MRFRLKRHSGVSGFRLGSTRLGLLGSIRLLLRTGEHLHGINKNLSDITLYTVLVIVTAVTDVAFNIKLVTLMNVFFNGFGQTSPEYEVVPFGTIGHLCAVLSSVATFCRGQGKVSYTNMVVQISYIRILTHISNQNNFVN